MPLTDKPTNKNKLRQKHNIEGGNMLHSPNTLYDRSRGRPMFSAANSFIRA